MACTTARVTAGGGTILNGPMQVPGGQWVVQSMDPQGAAFSLVALQRWIERRQSAAEAAA